MPAPRHLYGLCGSDGVIRYVGSTMQSLLARLSRHLSDFKRGDNNLGALRGWLRSVGRARVEIVLLRERVTIQDELAEIARRLAVGEPLLNVRGGGRLAYNYEAHAPAPLHSARPHDQASALRADPGWKLLRDAIRPVVPREPLHPYNRTPSQVAALAAKRAARVARQEAA